ncbi:MAG TPA: hypothetical protein VFA68_17905 [Terriglobales bacterium]|nr:hypothetical protein [Terriglobales bacterium]
MSRSFRYPFLVLFILSSSFALAQNFPIIGSGTLTGATEEKTNARGTDFYFAGLVLDAPDVFGFCFSGQVCSGTALTGANVISVLTNQVPLAGSGGCLGDVCTPGGFGHGISGNLNVTYKFSFLTPTADQDINLAVPLTVSGSMSAIGSGGKTLWTVDIVGKGTAQLSGTLASGLLSFDNITFKYAGTGSVVATH